MTTKNSNEYPAELVLPDKIMTELEFCEHVRREPRTVLGWRQAGKAPPFFRIGQHIFYQMKDVENFVIPRCKPRGQPFGPGGKALVKTTKNPD
jgi:hypothetical protein